MEKESHDEREDEVVGMELSDNEAEKGEEEEGGESSGSDQEEMDGGEGGGGASLHPSQFLDKEAEESDDGEDDGEDDEDDDAQGMNEYEADGFLVLDGEDGVVEPEVNKSRRNEERYVPLEEDDLELIGRKKKKKAKRLKRKGEVAEEEVEEDDVEEDDGDVREMDEEEEDLEEDDERAPRRVKREEREGEDYGYDDGFIVGAKRGKVSEVDYEENARGVTDQQLTEWQEIFGDENGMDAFVPDGDFVPEGEEAPEPVSLPMEESQGAGAGPKDLLSVFEPAVLQGQFMTAKDLEVRGEDVPERFQMRIPDRAPPEPKELDNEVGWILRMCFLDKLQMEDERVDISSKIFNVLHFMRVDLLEVPYIVQYRADYVKPQLTEEDCWLIQEWDEKWYHLNKRKQGLLNMYGNVQEMVKRGAVERYIELIPLAETEEDLEDLADYFHFYFPDKRQEAEMRTIRRPGTRDRHVDAEKQGYSEKAKVFGITAAQFGENLWNNQMVHTPLDNAEGPEEMVADLANPEKGRTVTQVIASCRAYLARQIANDPYVRNSMRDIYNERLTVSTFPTEGKGIEEIDYWHPFRNVKRLEKVPLSEFKNSDLFALILDAEKNGYIRVELDVGDYLDEMLERYNSKSYDAVSLSWNKQRRSILTEALSLYLHPRMKKEFRKKLEEWACDHISKLAAEKVFEHIGKQELSRTLLDPDDYYNLPRGEDTMAICIPADHQESPFAVVVDAKGNLKKFEKVSFIEARGGNRFGQESRREMLKNEDIQKVQELILEYEPGVIVIGVHQGSAGSRLAKEAFQVRKDEVMMDGPILGPIRDRLNVTPSIEYIDGSIAHVFRNTETSIAEFPRFSAPFRECISLARCAVNPLAEYSRLWDESWSIGFTPFHELQHMVPKRMLRSRFEQAFIRATCLVGVDLNAAWKFAHLSATLQFVPGLGPRKARGLLKTIELSGKTVERRTGDLRKMLVTEDDSDVVYVNSIAYLRIVDRYFDGGPLDNSRVHPSDYRFAYKIALDALEDNAVQGSQDKETEINNVIRAAMEPDRRDDVVRVEVEGMAQVWKDNYNEEKLLTLQSLKEEMLAPFKDLRGKRESLTDEEAFYIYSGENRETLPEGKLMSGTVRAAGKNGVRIDMEDGMLSGFVRRDMLSDKHIDSVQEITSAGFPIKARLMQVNFERWELELSCRGSDLENPRYESYQNLQEKHPYLKWRAAEAEKLKLEDEKYEAEKARAKRRERQGVSTMRVVDHPSFKNFTVEQVKKALEDAPCGEAVFRPSTKGLDFLTLSFKGLKDQVVHMVVVEKEKPTPLALGRRLSIKGFSHDEYEDLDEVIARYVNPVAQYMTMLSQHRRFSPLPEEELSALVQEEKKNDPKTIAYRIGIDEKNPGWFKIFFVPNEKTVHHEVISLRPTGFRLRSRVFGTITEMLNWWKKHWRDKDVRKKSSGRRDQGSKRVDRRRG